MGGEGAAKFCFDRKKRMELKTSVERKARWVWVVEKNIASHAFTGSLR